MYFTQNLPIRFSNKHKVVDNFYIIDFQIHIFTNKNL